MTDTVRTAVIALNKGIVTVQYAVVGDLAVFETDIILGTIDEVERQTALLRQRVATEGVVITGERFRWPGARVPFTIAPNLPNPERVREAIAHWEEHTRFRFVQRTNENDFVTFRAGTDCMSSVGRQTRQQFVDLGPGCLRGQTIHEIGHVVGLWHEHSRDDRDQFVRIEEANIDTSQLHNFTQRVTDGDDVGPYDYGSIMHYGSRVFTRNGRETIVAINPPGAAIGQRIALSAGDIEAANRLAPRETAFGATDPDDPHGPMPFRPVEGRRRFRIGGDDGDGAP
jgi:hypothetical protein